MSEPLSRYPAIETATSVLSRRDEVLNWICGLTSADVVAEVLRSAHAMPKGDVRVAAKAITVFVRHALRFIEQADAGPKFIASLPSYYAFLQLAKAMCVARGLGADVVKHRHHGLTYKPDLKDSRSIINEEIGVKDGVFKTLFRAIAPSAAPLAIKRIRMRDVYPYILESSVEYARAVSGRRIEPVPAFTVVTRWSDPGYIILAYSTATPANAPFLRKFKLAVDVPPSLFGIHGISTSAKRYMSKVFHDAAQLAWREELPTYLLWHQLGGTPADPPVTPLVHARLALPEELFIYAATFHLGSVARYKPDFLEQQFASKLTPFVLSLEQSGPFKFLSLFYDFMTQRRHILI